jgi:hypothetical protein
LGEAAGGNGFTEILVALERLDAVDAGAQMVVFVVAETPKGEILRAEFKASGQSKGECFYSPGSTMDAVADTIQVSGDEETVLRMSARGWGSTVRAFVKDLFCR